MAKNKTAYLMNGLDNYLAKDNTYQLRHNIITNKLIESQKELLIVLKGLSIQIPNIAVNGIPLSEYSDKYFKNIENLYDQALECSELSTQIIDELQNTIEIVRDDHDPTH
jgi:hypothetical protein